MSKSTVTCLCGSSRFKDEHLAICARETLLGKIVLMSGFFHHRDKVPIDDDIKRKLDELHLRKIDMSDEILVLNVNGYVGYSTKQEIAYALARDKPVRWLSPEDGAEYMRYNMEDLGELVARFRLKDVAN